MFLTKGQVLTDEEDQAELIEEIFGERGAPAGLELVEATHRPTGESILRFETEGVVEELVFVRYSSAKALEKVFGGGGGDGDFRGRGRGRGGEGEGQAQADSGRMIAWEKDPSFEWHTTIDAGYLSWGPWQANYKTERLFQEGGRWRDSVWVNLAQPDLHLALFSLWPEETEVDLEQITALLSQLELREKKS